MGMGTSNQQLSGSCPIIWHFAQHLLDVENRKDTTVSCFMRSGVKPRFSEMRVPAVITGTAMESSRTRLWVLPCRTGQTDRRGLKARNGNQENGFLVSECPVIDLCHNQPGRAKWGLDPSNQKVDVGVHFFVRTLFGDFERKPKGILQFVCPLS